MRNARIEALIQACPYASAAGYDEQQENYVFDMVKKVEGHPDVVVPCRVAPFAAEGTDCAMSSFDTRVELTLFQGNGYAYLGFALATFFG